MNIPAIVVCLLVRWILSRGAKAFGRFELIAVAIKVILILLIIGLDVFYIDTNNYNPFMPSGFGPVLAGMQNYKDIGPTAGFASLSPGGLPIIATIISVFTVLSILTVMLTFLLGVTLVWFSISRDGLLPGWFAKTDRHGTPQRVYFFYGRKHSLMNPDSPRHEEILEIHRRAG